KHALLARPWFPGCPGPGRAPAGRCGRSSEEFPARSPSDLRDPPPHLTQAFSTAGRFGRATRTWRPAVENACVLLGAWRAAVGKRLGAAWGGRLAVENAGRLLGRQVGSPGWPAQCPGADGRVAAHAGR